MDPISGVASVWTLIEAASLLVKAASDFKDAPEELCALLRHLIFLKAELEQLGSLDEDKRDDLVPAFTRKSLATAFSAASDAITDIEQCYSGMSSRATVGKRLKWAILDRRTTSRLLDRLHGIESHLNALCQLISVRGLYGMMDRFDAIESTITRMSVPSPLAQVQPSHSVTRASLRGQAILKTTGQPKVFTAMGSSLMRRDGDMCTDYALSIRWNLPLATILGPYMFMLAVSFRTFPLCSSISLLDSGGMSLTKVVHSNSPLMVACSLGDLLMVRDLFREGEGRPDFATEANLTPLAFAIQSGNLDLVHFLIDHGAGVNWPFGKFQTNPLQWAIWHKRLDIARALIQRGASLEHANAFGWTALFFCWPLMKPNQPGMLNYLRVISQDPSLDLNIRDVEGWTVLRRAAAFGTSEEVMELVRLGADPADLSSSLSWTALFYAAHFGNWNTFRALLSLETGPIEDIVDARGYTLLHVVASEGHEDIMRTLLEAGVDPSRACRPSIRPGVPQELYGKACTAGEVAAAAGLGILRAYIDVLGDRVDEGLRNVELPDDLEIYWDAETVVVDQSA